MYIKRELENLVKKYSDNFKVVVITGPRQVGKTTMLQHLMEEEISRKKQRSYITLDDLTVLELAKKDPELFFQRYKTPLLIDEIQKAPELLPYIKIIVDKSNKNGQIWLTGSQPFHLMKGISESLAGRAGIIEMYGLSNAEIGGFKSDVFDPSPDYFTNRINIAKKLDVQDVYSRICKGSLPAIFALPNSLRAGGYESYINTYIMRDIRDLSQVGDELKFRRFMRACASLTSKPVVYAELARIADIDEKTAKKWLSILESSYIVKIVEPYFNYRIKRLSKQPIMHFLDTGLAAYLAGWDNPIALETGAYSGQILESYTFCEIYKSFINAGVRAPIYFFRTNDKKEIDLILDKNNTLYPIEIKKSATPKLKHIKNFSALNPVIDNYRKSESTTFKQKLGFGAVICLSNDTFPITKNTWAFPVWAI